VECSLGVVEQTLGNWVKQYRAGTLKDATSKPRVTAEQMEISRLRAELVRVTMERDILHPTDKDLSMGTPAWEKRRRSSQRGKDETIAWLLWYNRTRMHSMLNYVSPVQFEQDWMEATEKIAA